jgi:glycosyltransferase involved in cell wall biosynthesis
VHTGRAAVDRAAALVDSTMGRQVLVRATAVLAVSQRTAAFVQELAGRTAEVIGNATDLSVWRPVVQPAPARRLVFAGRLAREKGWPEFLRVVAAVHADDVARGVTDPLDAVVAGAGDDLEAVRRAVAGLGLDDVVRVVGHLDGPALAAELAGAVYVNPSRAAEGFQLTQLEAAAAGAQVVTYDVGVASELAAVGAPVIVVPVGAVDALTEGARDALARPRPPAPREALSRWDADAFTDRYLAVLQRVSMSPTARGDG